ncbi:MAG TPA: hypothetical protein VIP51_05485 [Eoetvoesiella sp.]
MSTVTVKGLVHKGEYQKDLLVFPNDMSEYGYVLIGPVEFEYTMPANFNAVAAQLAALDKKLTSIHREYARQIAHIEDKKAKLLCIENGVTAHA